MYSIDQIHAIHGRIWNAGLGSISAEEAAFLQDGVASDNPTNVIEVGTASGLSTGFLALFMD
jgi:predicted O-methyltransferase YrrM